MNQAITALPDERRAVLEDIISRVNPARLVPSIPYFETLDLNRLRTQLGIDYPSPETVAIADNVSSLIPHGATIQVGVGTPSSYMPRLGVFDDKIDLGLHTELTVPGVAKLVDAGVINGSRKTIHRNRAVAVSWSGANDEDLQIIDDNPIFELYSPEYLLDPWLIAKNHAQIGMNNGLSVDFSGQIASESVLGGRMINGIGGQPRNAYRSAVLQGRTCHHPALLHRSRWSRLTHSSKARIGRACHHASFLGRYCCHRIRSGRPSREKSQRTRRGTHCHSPPPFQART